MSSAFDDVEAELDRFTDTVSAARDWYKRLLNQIEQSECEMTGSCDRWSVDSFIILSCLGFQRRESAAFHNFDPVRVFDIVLNQLGKYCSEITFRIIPKRLQTLHCLFQEAFRALSGIAFQE